MDYTEQYELHCKDEPHFTLELSTTQALKVALLRVLDEGNL
jgi:hypothetical protein